MERVMRTKSPWRARMGVTSEEEVEEAARVKNSA